MLKKESVEIVGRDLLIRKSESCNKVRKRLLCFPPAGGYSIFFDDISKSMPDDWGVWSIDPPGHGFSRVKCLSDIDSVEKYYLERLKDFFELGFYFLGHSLGGLVSYRLVSKLETMGIYPKALILCAATPPHLIDETVDFDKMTDQELISFLVGMNGISANAINDKIFLKLFIPVFRADYRVYKSLLFKGIPDKIKTPVWLFAGREDKLICYDKMNEWKPYAENIEIRILQGNHYFLQTNAEYVSGEICKLSRRYV